MTIIKFVGFCFWAFVFGVGSLEAFAQEFPAAGDSTFRQTATGYEAFGFGATEEEARNAGRKNLWRGMAQQTAPLFAPAKMNLQQESALAVVARILATFEEDLKAQAEVSSEPTATGVRSVYILPKAAMQNIFAKRKKMIHDLFKEASACADSMNVKDALKLYYFCVILANSIPEDSVYFAGRNLTAELPLRLNTILRRLDFAVQDDYSAFNSRRNVVLKVSFGGVPVTAIELCYFDGARYTCAEGKDGALTLELQRASVSARELEASIKYSYYESRQEIPAVEALWDFVSRPEFANRRRIALAVGPRASRPETAPGLTASVICPVVREITQETQKFLQVLRTGDSSGVATSYRHDAFLREKIQRLLRYNNPAILDADGEAKIDSAATGWEVRRIAVLNRYPTINKQSVEHLILDFSWEGKLVDVNFSIYDRLYKMFVGEGSRMQDWRKRQTIMKFVEKYRTAYLNRDTGTVNKIFAEDAIIIIGRVLENRQLANKYIYEQKSSGQPKVEYLRLSKSLYLKKLAEVFKIQSDIFLGFSSFKISLTANRKGVYGISMRQNYVSTTYADVGYLFLLIDFTSEHPLIHIRAWQPNEWDRSNLIRLTNYRYLGG